MKPVWRSNALREDICVRLAADGLSMPINELLRERADALCEITQLRISLSAAEAKQSAPFPAGGPESVHRSGDLEMEPGSMLRLPDVCRVFSLSRSSVYTWIAQGRFPRPVQVGADQYVGQRTPSWSGGAASATRLHRTQSHGVGVR